MVFQNYALYPHMTGRRNISFGMKSAGEFTDREIENGSTKHPKRSILPICWIGNPNRCPVANASVLRWAERSFVIRCLLMDEPLSNLDAKLRFRCAPS